MAILNPYNYKKPAGTSPMRMQTTAVQPSGETSVPTGTATQPLQSAPQRNQQDAYLEQRILSSKPEELTMMLYDGLVKFIKIARLFNEQKNIPKTHEAVVKAQAIVVELQSTLNMDYAISNELDQLYDFIYEKLVDGNLQKHDTPMAEALEISEQMRDTWKEAMLLI